MNRASSPFEEDEEKAELETNNGRMAASSLTEEKPNRKRLRKI